MTTTVEIAGDDMVDATGMWARDSLNGNVVGDLSRWMSRLLGYAALLGTCTAIALIVF